MLRYLLVFALICIGTVQSLSQGLRSELVERDHFLFCEAEEERVLVVGNPDPQVLTVLAAKAREVVLFDEEASWDGTEPFDMIVAPFTLGDFEDPEATLCRAAPWLKPYGGVSVYVEIHPEEPFFEIAEALFLARGLAPPASPRLLNGSVAAYRNVFDEGSSLAHDDTPSEKYQKIESWLRVFGDEEASLSWRLTFREAWSMENFIEGLTDRFADEWGVPEASRADFFAELASRYAEFLGPLTKEDSVADEWPSELSDDALIYQQPLSGYAYFVK